MIADHQAERAVIGAIFLDPRALFISLGVGLEARAFDDPKSRAIYGALEALGRQNASCDVVAVAGYLADRGELKGIGGIPALAAYTEVVATAANVADHAARVRAKAKLRALVEESRRVVVEAERAEDPGAFLVDAQRRMVALTDDDEGSGVETAAEWTSRYYAQLERELELGQAPGISTGLFAFDRSGGGVKRGSMTVIAARPGMGKTAMLLTMANNMMERDHAGFIGSFEMARREIGDRLVANRESIDYQHIQDVRILDPDREWPAVARTMGELGEKHLDLWCVRGPHVDALRVRVMQSHARRPLDYAMFDYLQLIRADGRDMYERTSRVSNALKALAMELGIAVIVLAQLNREVERRQDKRPNKGDLRDSGAIEQDADQIALLYRPAEYFADADEDEAELIIDKQRHGTKGPARMRWNGRYQRFED